MKFASVALTIADAAAINQISDLSLNLIAADTDARYNPLGILDTIVAAHNAPPTKRISSMGPESAWRHDCGKLVPAFGRKHPVALAQTKNSLPGAGMKPDEIEPFQKVLKDGFMEVDCVKDAMYEAGDKFGSNKNHYKMGAVSNSSIVHYNDHIAKEDREKMTPAVCFEFCRTIDDMGYFGISNGRDCYCTSFFKQMAGDSSDCDSVCEGDTSQMCGGKTKNTIWSMHWCDTMEEDLEKAHDAGEGAHFVLNDFCSNMESVADSSSEAAQEMQDHFGQIGDPAASNLLQGANVFAGKWLEKAKGCMEVVDDLDKKVKASKDAEGGDFTQYEVRKAAEDAMAAVKEATDKASALATELKEAWSSTAQPHQKAGAGQFLPAVLSQYYSIMYFIDKEFEDDSEVPVTCNGDLIGEPVIGATPESCAAACDAKVGECVGFMVLAAEHKGETGYLCYLFESFTSAQYYTGCDDSKKGAFLQKANHGHLGGFHTKYAKHEHWTSSNHTTSAKCAKMRSSTGCASAREATVAGTGVASPDTCYLAPGNSWSHDQLPAYFNCLTQCCEDYDPSRIFDGITPTQIVNEFGVPCDGDVPGYVPPGTQVVNIAPDFCGACEAPPPPVPTPPPPPPVIPQEMPAPEPVPMVVMPPTKLDNPVQAMCRAKFSEFGSINLKPDPKGKNKFALKELTKADRCSY